MASCLHWLWYWITNANIFQWSFYRHAGLSDLQKGHNYTIYGYLKLFVAVVFCCRRFSCTGYPMVSHLYPCHLQYWKGVFNAELNEFLARTLGEDGYAGVEVRVTPIRTEIIIRATRTREVLGEKGRRIRELTALVQKRFGFPESLVFAAKKHHFLF